MSAAVRRACVTVIAGAVENGICGEAEAWRMTPAELTLRMRAAERAALRRMKDMDLLAWLIGQYCAVALNAPQRYPQAPDRVRERAVGDEEMQRFMRAFARRKSKGGGE